MTPAVNAVVPTRVRDVASVSYPIAEAIQAAPAAYFRWKGVLDRTLAALLLVPALPIIGLLMVLVRLTSPGPGMFRQLRVGKGGHCFEMLKLRSMRSDAEKDGAVWSQPGDSRVTFLGRILRKLHLDELPQLINVLRGEMSLIGPRPERPEFVHILSEQIPGYLNRLAVLPGVTGLAQVNLPPDSDTDSVRRKLLLDLDYVDQANLWLDLRLLLCTAGRMVRLPLRRALGLRRRVQLPETAVTKADTPENADSAVREEAASTIQPHKKHARHSRALTVQRPK